MKNFLLRFRFVIYGLIIGDFVGRVLEFFISKGNHVLFLSLYIILTIGTIPVVLSLDKKFIKQVK